MASLRIDVAYALPERQEVVRVVLPPGTTVREAVQASGLAARHPEIDLSKQVFGVFGKRAPPDTVVEDGDRVEIYRPLTADPKLARRRRALRKS